MAEISINGSDDPFTVRDARYPIAFRDAAPGIDQERLPSVPGDVFLSPPRPPKPPRSPIKWPSIRIDARKAVFFTLVAAAALWLGPLLISCVYHAQAMNDYEQDDYKHAAAAETAALRWAFTSPPQKADCLLWRGYDHLFAYELAAASSDFKASIRLSPGLQDTGNDGSNLYWMVSPPSAYKGRFWADFASKHYATAFDECRHMIALNPSYVENYGIRGKCYRGLGRYALAETDFRTVMARKPHLLFPYLHLADMQEQDLHEPQAAVATMQAAVQANPANADAWGALGWHQYGAGAYDEALASNQKSLAISSTTSQDYVRVNIALIYTIQDDWSAAMPLYEATVRDNDAATLQGALKDVQDALKKHPDSMALHEALQLINSASATHQPAVPIEET